jgi:hypothetical protein
MQYFMTLPLVVFGIMLLAGRKELGWKGVVAFIAIWAALLAGVHALRLDPHFFIAGESILDVALISTIYIGFTRLR